MPNFRAYAAFRQNADSAYRSLKQTYGKGTATDAQIREHIAASRALIDSSFGAIEKASALLERGRDMMDRPATDTDKGKS